jgi:hypothetical protein
VNPQIAVPELELMQVHLHAVTLHQAGRDRSLVFPLRPTNSSGFPRRISHLPSPLVLRVDREDSSQSRKDHNGFWRHRVLRDVPGHSRQWRRSIRRWRR